MKISRTMLVAALALAGAVSTPAGPAGAVGSVFGALDDVSCATTKMCVAVGYRTTEAGPIVALAFHWDGSSWARQVMPAPPDSSQVEVRGVACSTASSCEAVGVHTRDSNSSFFDMFAEKWNGSSWSVQTLPSLVVNTSSQLNAISCSSTTACTAVGYKEFGGVKHPLVERWNGTNWHGQALPPLPDDGMLDGVSCPTDTACTAIGSIDASPGRIVVHWDGRSWAKQVTPIPDVNGAKFASFDNVTCTSATRCTAVGRYSIYNSVCCSYTVHMLIEKWNGTAWTVQSAAPGGSNFELSDIACTTSTACTAVGDYFSQTEPVASPTAYRWNGSAWHSQPTGSWFGVSRFVGVDCPALSKCFAVGHSDTLVVISRWNGTDWKRQR